MTDAGREDEDVPQWCCDLIAGEIEHAARTRTSDPKRARAAAFLVYDRMLERVVERLGRPRTRACIDCGADPCVCWQYERYMSEQQTQTALADLMRLMGIALDHGAGPLEVAPIVQRVAAVLHPRTVTLHASNDLAPETPPNPRTIPDREEAGRIIREWTDVEWHEPDGDVNALLDSLGFAAVSGPSGSGQEGD